MTIKTCIFDAYGTLFDVTAAARKAAHEPEHAALKDTWPTLAAHWRDKQRKYTWLRAVTGDHTNFWQVTQDGLDWAMEAMNLHDPGLRERLLALYWELDAYPEVPDMLAALKADGFNTGILSNGSPEMLDGAVESAGLEELLDAVLSVETVGVFKPDTRVYDLVTARFVSPRDNVLFVSSNGWDAASAMAYGFQTVWVNRAGLPMDRLPGKPTHVCDDLTAIAELARTL